MKPNQGAMCNDLIDLFGPCCSQTCRKMALQQISRHSHRNRTF